MEYLLTVHQFLEKLKEQENKRLSKEFIDRNQELAGIKEIGEHHSLYAIELIISPPEGIDLLLEYKQYKQFRKTTNLYTQHPENPSIPVKAHYHIYPSNSKKELYAVNIDGTAHHRSNQGHTIPSKEADELRSLGVAIPSTNIIESIVWLTNESATEDYFSFFIIMEEE